MHRFALLILPVALLTVPLYPCGESEAAPAAPAATVAAPCSTEVALEEERAPNDRVILPDLLGGAYPSMSVPLSRRG